MDNNLLNIFFSILVAVLVTYIFINSDRSIVIAYSKFDESLKYLQFLYNGPIGFHTLNIVQSYNNSDIDVFGIRKLYESKPDTFEWYMNMVNPQEDPQRHMTVKEIDGYRFFIGVPTGPPSEDQS